MARVFIPSAIRPLVDGQEFVDATGANIRRIIDDLDERFPGVKDRLCENDRLRPELSISVDGSFSTLGVLQSVGPDAEIHFLPAIGGG